MSATTVTAELPARRAETVFPARLVRAELLKLRRRRGLVVSVLALTVLPVVIAYGVLLTQSGPAGGLKHLREAMAIFPLLCVVAAILVGATLGAGDLGAGLFRELVVTGRSRLALFAARVPAGLALLIPIVAAAFGIAAVASTIFAGSLEIREHSVDDYRAPGAMLLLQSGAWLVLVTALAFVLALGVSSLIGSRGTSIGVLLGWWLVAMPVVVNVGSFGDGMLMGALDRVAPRAAFDNDSVVSMSLAVAVCVLLAWAVVPLALGAWRTCTRDA